MYYYKLWVAYLDKSIKQWKEYKMDFIFISVASILTILISVINIEILFSRVDNIMGWNKFEILWMYGYFNFIQCIFSTFFVNCFDVSSWVYTGKIDILKIRPCFVFFQLICSDRYNVEFPIDQFVVGLALMIRAGIKLNLEWSAFKVLELCGLMIFSVIIYACIVFIISSMSLWIVRSNYFIEMIFELERVNEYPINVYGNGVCVLLTYIIPIGFVSFYPNLLFLERSGGGIVPLLIPAVAIILLVIAFVIWHLGLSRYQSPNS